MAHRAAEVSAALQGRYTIEHELGRGGMATTVYLAEDLRLHRRVALKILHPELGATLGPERFPREIDIASRLTHPHILALYDAGKAHGRLFYAMPYVEGESPRQRLQREPQLPVEETVRIVRAVASALEYAHREAEQRFGDGDGVFTVAERSRAINALYDVMRGEHAHTAPGRRARVGVEIAF